jgi:hypothetical protein
MFKSSQGLAAKAIACVVELSADAHIARRGTAKDSPEFRKLSRAIKAYGKVLAFLTALQQREEFYTVSHESGFSECVVAAVGQGSETVRLVA